MLSLDPETRARGCSARARAYLDFCKSNPLLIYRIPTDSYVEDAELERILLTHEGRKRAQELLPQLLVLVARNNLVYSADLTPSFMVRPH